MVDEQIRSRGVKDERVLQAMEVVPRERFVRPQDAAQAFSDRALPIGDGQTISQPFMVAGMTAALKLEPHHRVLEIGTGSGYQTAVLAELAEHVYTVERIAALSDKAKDLLASIGVNNVTYHVTDGTMGWPKHAPFDRILVTAGAPTVPQSLVEQLAEQGRLVIPVGDRKQLILTIVDKHADAIREHPTFACRFVKLIGEQGWSQA